MTQEEKTDILRAMDKLLGQMVGKEADILPERCQMLTIKECTELAEGLSEHTVRILIKKGTLPAMRAGEGKRGKLLIPKTALMSYLKGIGK